MRVTNRMMIDSAINTINDNLLRLEKFQKQLATGERVSRPSDDPAAVARLLTAKAELKSREQYHQNMQDAVGWLDATDGALEMAGDVLQRLRELAVDGADGGIPDQSMKALADEVDQLIEELVGIGNTYYAGRYIFAGGMTTEPPFKIVDIADGIRVQFIKDGCLDDGETDENRLDETYSLELEVEKGVKMDLCSGRLTFHTDTGGKPAVNAVFDLMIDLSKNLKAGNRREVGKLIGEFEKANDNLLSERAITGAKSKRISSLQDRSTAYEIDLKTLISRLGYVEYEEAAINFSAQQAIYQAALATGARVIQPSLMDYLR